jgi:hypothetical protein
VLASFIFLGRSQFIFLVIDAQLGSKRQVTNRSEERWRLFRQRAAGVEGADRGDPGKGRVVERK